MLHFPRGKKYVSVLKPAADPEQAAVLAAERTRLRALVHAQLAEAALVGDADEGAALLARQGQVLGSAARILDDAVAPVGTARVVEGDGSSVPRQGLGSGLGLTDTVCEGAATLLVDPVADFSEICGAAAYGEALRGTEGIGQPAAYPKDFKRVGASMAGLSACTHVEAARASHVDTSARFIEAHQGDSKPQRASHAAAGPSGRRPRDHLPECSVAGSGHAPDPKRRRLAGGGHGSAEAATEPGPGSIGAGGAVAGQGLGSAGVHGAALGVSDDFFLDLDDEAGVAGGAPGGAGAGGASVSAPDAGAAAPASGAATDALLQAWPTRGGTAQPGAGPAADGKHGVGAGFAPIGRRAERAGKQGRIRRAPDFLGASAGLPSIKQRRSGGGDLHQPGTRAALSGERGSGPRTGAGGGRLAHARSETPNPEAKSSPTTAARHPARRGPGVKQRRPLALPAAPAGALAAAATRRPAGAAGSALPGPHHAVTGAKARSLGADRAPGGVPSGPGAPTAAQPRTRAEGGRKRRRK